MPEAASKPSIIVPKRINISSAKTAMIPMVPFASSHLLGGACVIAGLDPFAATPLLSMPQQLPQQPMHNIFEQPMAQVSSEQEASSDVHEVCPRRPPTKKRLSSEQVKLLESSFDLDSKLEPERKNKLAGDLGLQPRQVAVWYQNKRARSKTKQLERMYDLLKLQFQAIAEEKQQLETEVSRLRELLGLQEEKIPDNGTSDTIPTATEEAGLVTRKLGTGATVDHKLCVPKEAEQSITINEEKQKLDDGEETAVETEAESVELSCSGTPCSGTGLSEALDPNSPPCNICDFSQNTSGLTQSTPPFIIQPNVCTDQMPLYNQQQQHMLHQLHNYNWTSFHQPGSVKLEHDEQGYLSKPYMAEGDQLYCSYFLQDDSDSVNFDFVT